MGLYSKIFHSKPQKLTPHEFALFGDGVHALRTNPKGLAKDYQGPNQLCRSSKGIHAIPLKPGEKPGPEDRKARQLIAKHLKDPSNRKRYGKANADKALKALTCLKSGFNMDELGAMMDPVSKAEQRAQTKAFAQQVIQSAQGLAITNLAETGAGLPSGELDVRAAGGDAVYQAADSRGLVFERRCCTSDGDNKLLRKAKEGLNASFANAFGTHPLTRELGITPDSLCDEMLSKPGKLINQKITELNALLDMDYFPGGEAKRQERILTRTQELVACIAQSAELLALVGNCLTNELARQAPSAVMQASMENLGSHLVRLAQTYLDPKGFYMDSCRYARAQHQNALHGLAGEKVAEAANAVKDHAQGLLNAGAGPLPHGGAPRPSESAQEIARQAHEAAVQSAQTAGRRFDGVEPAVLDELYGALLNHSLTQKLATDRADLFDVLLRDFPSSLNEAMEQLNQTVARSQTEAGRRDPALQEAVIRQSQQLVALVARYMELLATVGHILVNEVPLDDLAMAEQRKLMDGFGIALVGLSQTVADPDGPYGVLVGKVRAQEHKATQLLTELRTGSDATGDLRKAAELVKNHWQGFFDLCLTPKDGLNGLTPEQRRAKEAWTAQWPIDADETRVPSLAMSALLTKEWPERIEAQRVQLEQLLNSRGPKPDQALEEKILASSRQLIAQSDHYFAQLESSGRYLAEKFPTDGMPGSFQVAARQVGNSLLALKAVQQRQAYRFAEQAKAEAQERLKQAHAAARLAPTVPVSGRAKTGSSAVFEVSAEEDRQLEEALKADALPSPRRQPLSGELDDEALKQLGDQEWLDYVISDERRQATPPLEVKVDRRLQSVGRLPPLTGAQPSALQSLLAPAELDLSGEEQPATQAELDALDQDLVDSLAGLTGTDANAVRRRVGLPEQATSTVKRRRDARGTLQAPDTQPTRAQAPRSFQADGRRIVRANRKPSGVPSSEALAPKRSSAKVQADHTGPAEAQLPEPASQVQPVGQHRWVRGAAAQRDFPLGSLHRPRVKATPQPVVQEYNASTFDEELLRRGDFAVTEPIDLWAQNESAIQNAPVSRAKRAWPPQSGRAPTDVPSQRAAPNGAAKPAQKLSPAELQFAIRRRLLDTQHLLQSLNNRWLARSARSTLTPQQEQWKESFAAALEADVDLRALDLDYLAVTLAAPPSYLDSGYAELSKLNPGNNHQGNTRPSDLTIAARAQSLAQRVERYLSSLHKVGQLLVDLAQVAQQDPALAKELGDTGRSLLELEQLQRHPDNPLMQRCAQIQALGQEAQRRLDSKPSPESPVFEPSGRRSAKPRKSQELKGVDRFLDADVVQAVWANPLTKSDAPSKQ